MLTLARSSASSAPPGFELDELTLRRAQRGEADALRDVIVRHQPAVHALVWRMLGGAPGAGGGSANDVDDLVQDCFVRVLRALPGFDPRGPAKLSTWILTIATRVVLNDRRRPPPVALEHAPEPAAAPAHGPAAEVDRAQLAAAIGAAVAALPEAQRAVLVLREYHDLEYAEIAHALELDLGTVKSRLARARADVRDALARAMPDRFPTRDGGPR
jgi:RNA polymerase sigma-70 factor (ECF subfamily)